MALINCPDCGSMVSDMVSCPSCALKVQTKKETKRYKGSYILLASNLFILILFATMVIRLIIFMWLYC